MTDRTTIDDLTVVGIDGIRRSFDEHYDTMMEVDQDPTGAHHAIQNQHDRIKELEAKLARAVEDFETMADTDPDDGTTWFHEFAHAAIAKIKGDHP